MPRPVANSTSIFYLGKGGKKVIRKEKQARRHAERLLHQNGQTSLSCGGGIREIRDIFDIETPEIPRKGRRMGAITEGKGSKGGPVRKPCSGRAVVPLKDWTCGAIAATRARFSGKKRSKDRRDLTSSVVEKSASTDNARNFIGNEGKGDSLQAVS